ncbi:TPX2 C-terminal domain-containing protein [Pleurotus pulmonarius]|nr:hypothetical protein EYR36_006331 [Pleurotus pulmonarius]KAF4601032.1 hypothetical protein EYR38_005681 [Pleurotus pulmonarius]
MPASSIFARPASPPPRAPSPVFEPEPLPSPQLRMRQPRSQTSMTSLQGMDRSLFSARSCSNLTEDSLLKRKSSRLTIDSLNSSSSCSSTSTSSSSFSSSSSSSSCSSASSPITPRSFTLPLPPVDPPAAKRTKSRHHRSHSIVVPSPRRRSSSPPPAPSPREVPPPVPAIPAVLLTPTDKKPVLRKKTSKEKRITPIYLPELDVQSPAMGSNPFSAKAIKAHEERERDELARVEREGKEQEKEKKGARRDTAMTCLKFFSMKNASAAAA